MKIAPYIFVFLFFPLFAFSQKDTATFKDGTELHYEVLATRADQMDPFYVYALPNHSDIRFGFLCGGGMLIRKIGFVEADLSAGSIESTGEKRNWVNKWGGQAWIFVAKKEKPSKNSITVGRKGLGSTYNPATGQTSGAYMDYRATIDVTKMFYFAAHVAYFNKTYLGRLGGRVTVDGTEYHVTNAYCGEMMAGISYVRCMYTKWKVYGGNQSAIFRESSLYRLTLDALYYANPSADQLTGYGAYQTREMLPENVVNTIFVRKISFRFLAEAWIPYSPTRTNYGFTFQAGVTRSPFDNVLEPEYFPLIGAGIYVRPGWK